MQGELDEERQICAYLRKDKDLLARQKDELEKLRRQEMATLEEQLNDLMMHFETQAKIQKELEKGTVNQKVISNYQSFIIVENLI